MYVFFLNSGICIRIMLFLYTYIFQFKYPRLLQYYIYLLLLMFVYSVQSVRVILGIIIVCTINSCYIYLLYIYICIVIVCTITVHTCIRQACHNVYKTVQKNCTIYVLRRVYMQIVYIFIQYKYIRLFVLSDICIILCLYYFCCMLYLL